MNWLKSLNSVRPCPGGGAGEYDRASLPGPAVPDRRGCGAHHEDEEDSEPQPAGVGALQPAQVPRQGDQSHAPPNL